MKSREDKITINDFIKSETEKIYNEIVKVRREIHMCPELGDEDKEFSELYNKLNEIIDLHGQGLFEKTQDTMKKHDISINIDDLDEDDSAIYERLLEIYHEYDNDFKSDILELIESHSKLSKVATV